MNYGKSEYLQLDTFEHYLASLSSPVDAFLEEHLLESEYQRIIHNDAEVGFFATRNDALLTQFHLTGTARRLGRECFTDILERFNPTSAFVPTCDEFFLSHALDKHTSLKNQAMFWTDHGEEKAIKIEAVKPTYRLAEPMDIPQLNAIENSILDDPSEWIQRGELHVGYLGNELVAIGVIESSKFWPGQASIGMLTHEAHRQQSIGTQTLCYLKKMCLDAGVLPVAGCAYANKNSQKTLQAAGMVSATRLLKLTL